MMKASWFFRLLSTGVSVFVAGAALAQACNEPFSRPSYPTRQAFCQPGQLVPDAYAFGKLTPCEDVEVDHLISLRQAWASGVCGDDLRRLARDPANLRITFWLTNRQKGYLSPQDFALRLPSELAKQVLGDANALMRDYGIKSREEAIFARMLVVTQRSAGQTYIPFSRFSNQIVERMTFRRVGGRSIAYLGKKVVGLALGVGAAIEVTTVASWASRWLTTPEQTDRMAMRATMLRNLLVDGDE